MTIIREFVFFNDACYNIFETMAYIDRLYCFGSDGLEFPEHRVREVLHSVSEFRLDGPYPEYICDCFTGVMIPSSYFFQKFGIEEDISHWISEYPLEDDIETVATFDLTDSSFELDNEECISDSEEEEICEVVRILFDLAEDNN